VDAAPARRRKKLVMSPGMSLEDWAVDMDSPSDSEGQHEEGSCASPSLASWALVGDLVESSEALEWSLIEGTSAQEPGSDELEAMLQKVVGPLKLNGMDYSQISFLMGEWVDSLGHFVKVVATGENSARACISWDHSGQYLANLWKATLKVQRDEEGHWTCGNGRLTSASLGRLCWQRAGGECTEWIRRFPASSAFLSAYVTPPKRTQACERRGARRGTRRTGGRRQVKDQTVGCAW